jgi:hypothetical protein
MCVHARRRIRNRQHSETRLRLECVRVVSWSWHVLRAEACVYGTVRHVPHAISVVAVWPMGREEILH